jgi:hypothetical protein
MGFFTKCLSYLKQSTVLQNSHFFTRIRVNSHEFRKFHNFSREFAEIYKKYSHFSRNLFFTVWTANNAQNSLSWAFSKKSFVLKKNHVTSFYRENKDLL